MNARLFESLRQDLDVFLLPDADRPNPVCRGLGDPTWGFPAVAVSCTSLGTFHKVAYKDQDWGSVLPLAGFYVNPDARLFFGIRNKAPPRRCSRPAAQDNKRENVQVCVTRLAAWLLLPRCCYLFPEARRDDQASDFLTNGAFGMLLSRRGAAMPAKAQDSRWLSLGCCLNPVFPTSKNDSHKESSCFLTLRSIESTIQKVFQGLCSWTSSVR